MPTLVADAPDPYYNVRTESTFYDADDTTSIVSAIAGGGSGWLVHARAKGETSRWEMTSPATTSVCRRLRRTTINARSNAHRGVRR